MFFSTHKIIARQVISLINSNGYSINNRYFIWGNVKPDISPKLALKKHYPQESLGVIIDYIHTLCQLPASTLNTPGGQKYISVQIGIICHFLTDFFTLPHSLHWELKSYLIPHLKYETVLQSIASTSQAISIPSSPIITTTSRENIQSVITGLHHEYEVKEDYSNDLRFSIRISSLVVCFILNAIRKNIHIAPQLNTLPLLAM